MKNAGKAIAAAAAAATIIYTGYYVAGIGTDRIQQYRETQSIQLRELDRQEMKFPALPGNFPKDHNYRVMVFWKANAVLHSVGLQIIIQSGFAGKGDSYGYNI